MPELSPAEIASIAAAELLESDEFEPKRSPSSPKPRAGWYPDLNKPTQAEIFEDPTQFILAYGEKGCRTLDTWICTGRGVSRLGDLCPKSPVSGFNPIIQEVWANQNERAIADAYWVETDTTAIRVELGNGAEITGSPRHPIWACESTPDGRYSFRWVKFEELDALIKSGNRFWTPLIPHPSWDCENTMDLDLCYAIGALCGDGSLNFDTGDFRSIGFTNMDRECIDRVNKGLSVIGCRLNQSKSQKDRYQYSVLPKEAAANLLREIGLVGLSYSKRIPGKIVSSGKLCSAAFLSGLFDTDGTVCKHGNVSFCTTSEGLGRDVQDLLAVMGILSVRRSRKSASGNPTWTISIIGKHAYEFGKVVGFEIARKRNRIRGPKKSKLSPNGWNSNRYGYPDPIRLVMKKIAFRNRSGVKKPRKGAVYRNREWHNKFRSIHSFGSVPQRPKIDQFKSVYGSCGELDQFLVSDHWLEVVSVSESAASLADLRVPGPHSFLASGTLNHNSGKSIGMEHKLVRHLYENWDSLALIVTPSIRTGKFGVIHDLESLILPSWSDGIGLDWIPSKLDPNTKDRILKVGNRFGGWSTAIQIAIPYEEAIPARIKGIHPSMAFVDELTDCEGVGYFNLISAQLNRRRHISGPQQYVATCNPKGPSNWVYKKFFEDPVDHDTGVTDKKFKVYHVPFRENAHRPEMRSYIETLESAVKSDPIERARLIEGKWVERPTGESLFASHFKMGIHMVGDKKIGTGLCPMPGLPCVIGYDLGQVYNAAVFLQRVPLKGRMVWIVFDEVVHLKEKILYRNMASEIVEKILMWNSHVKRNLPWEHITDDSAVNQWRPNASGSYDAWDFEKEFNSASILHGLPQMKMRGVQKGAGSVETRVRLTQGSLINDEIFVSANCPFVIDMLMLLDAKKDEELMPRKTAAGHIHVFDALSYPMLHWNLKGPSVSTGPIASSFTMLS